MRANLNNMINSWSELLAAIKTWLATPLKWERTIEEDFTAKYEDLMRPRKYKDPFEGLEKHGRKILSDQYFQHLRDKIKHGEHLTQDELYRLQMDEHIHGINEALEHPEQDNNFPTDGDNKK